MNVVSLIKNGTINDIINAIPNTVIPINENALIVISCLGAFLIGEKMEGIMVVSLYILGKMYRFLVKKKVG